MPIGFHRSHSDHVRAEATFVVSGTCTLPSRRSAREHTGTSSVTTLLLEDVNELTALWHFKTTPAWPVT